MSKSPDQIVARYFELWKHQDADGLTEIFTPDAKYTVHPFGVEEYLGINDIQVYWRTHVVEKQVSPRPRIITSVFGENIGFVEWETTFTTNTNNEKVVRGILLMEFQSGLIRELREHYDVIKF